MPSSITTFVSNRGGIGKSSLVSQLAPALALQAPGRDVVVLDLSIQGDTSTFFLGGVAEPREASSGARTRGGEALAAISAGAGAAPLLAAALQRTQAVAAEESAPRSYFWRGVMAASPATAPPPPPPFDWRPYAVRPLDVHPEGNCPPNLFVIPGGKDLHGSPFAGMGPALRKALASSEALFLVDTDAELSERGASLAGIAAADRLALVASTSWTDYLRALDDPANSLMEALLFLKQVHPELAPRIAHVYFNNVQKRLGAPGGLAAMSLPFTPPASSLEAMADICTHLYSVAKAGRVDYFADTLALVSPDAFMRSYVTAVPTVPEGNWQMAAVKGQPVVCVPDQSSQQATLATHVRAAAARLASL